MLLKMTMSWCKTVDYHSLAGDVFGEMAEGLTPDLWYVSAIDQATVDASQGRARVVNTRHDSALCHPAQRHRLFLVDSRWCSPADGYTREQRKGVKFNTALQRGPGQSDGGSSTIQTDAEEGLTPLLLMMMMKMNWSRLFAGLQPPRFRRKVPFLCLSTFCILVMLFYWNLLLVLIVTGTNWKGHAASTQIINNNIGFLYMKNLE